MPLDENDKYADIDWLLRGVFKTLTLRDRFDKRLHELGINQTAALKLLKMERKTMLGIIDGTSKRTSAENLNKLAAFIGMSVDELIDEYTAQVQKKSIEFPTDAVKKKFIREHFDLAALKKAGFINDVADYNEIEKRIVSHFGLNSIFDYTKRSFDAAFMEGTIIPQNAATREFWLTNAKALAVKLDNPYFYDRAALVKYFPTIRWNTTNVEFGLINVIKALYKLGITVVFLPPMASLQLRGATFSVNDQPCIAITDYKGFYPTLWHCLIHELYHVLFDWDEIKANSYHLSEDPDTSFTISEIETDADKFAREYLFSNEKLEAVKPYLRDQEYICDIAKNNNIHSSFIYVYYAFEYAAIDRKAWARARKQMPEIKKALFRIDLGWGNFSSIDAMAKKLKMELYN